MKNTYNIKYIKPRFKYKKTKINFYFDAQPNLFAESCTPGSCPSPCVCRVVGCVAPPCFLSGTKILLADGSFIKIENIKPGDKVMSYDLKKSSFLTTTVSQITVHKDNPTGYYLINNILKVTKDHPIWIKNRGWIKVENLKIGDEVFDKEEKFTKIVKIKKISGINTVYDLSIKESPHNFFAEGILVHNKYACSPD